jgi:AraC-like DNA-binding protein
MDVSVRTNGGPQGAAAAAGLRSSLSHRIQAYVAGHGERDTAPEGLSFASLHSRVGLGVSALHKHFRETTGMTPLNYQKQLRLLVMETGDAGTVAARIGYESTSQFSREYRRMFGDAPIRNAADIRTRLLAGDARPRKGPST